MKKNFADDFIQGNYFVTIRDNRVAIAPIIKCDNITNAAAFPVHAQSVCCEEDEFDIGEAFKLCFERYYTNYIKGACVEITNSELCYSMNVNKIVEFAKKNPSKHDEILVYWKEGFKPITGRRGVIIDILDKYVLVKIDKNYFIMDKSGVKRV